MSSEDAEFRHSQVVVGGSSVHVVEAGDPGTAPFLFLHGWPESWRSWRSMISLASQGVRAIAIDLPGIGLSTGAATHGSKRELAAVVHQLVTAMELRRLTLVGQDVGGMVVYSGLRGAFADLERAVIMDTVIPGVDPWEQVLRNPYIWHFAMHAIPRLPERLVQGRQREYFDYFYDVLSADPHKITAQARADYVQAYGTDSALTAGFNWYRTFAKDAVENKEAASRQGVTTPVLYLRGEQESGQIGAYVEGFRAAGLVRVDHGLVPAAGHFTQEEAPDDTWRLIAEFAGL
jgi:pimeloyl-ACP methyl ester carboxylesterase